MVLTRSCFLFSQEETEAGSLVTCLKKEVECLCVLLESPTFVSVLCFLSSQRLLLLLQELLATIRDLRLVNK